MGELDMDGRRRRTEGERKRVAEGSRRQMREMVAVMGKRESEGEKEGAGRRAEGMFTTGNEYDILGEGEGSLAYRQRMEGG